MAIYEWPKTGDYVKTQFGDIFRILSTTRAVRVYPDGSEEDGAGTNWIEVEHLLRRSGPLVSVPKPAPPEFKLGQLWKLAPSSPVVQKYTRDEVLIFIFEGYDGSPLPLTAARPANEGKSDDFYGSAKSCWERTGPWILVRDVK